VRTDKNSLNALGGLVSIANHPRRWAAVALCGALACGTAAATVQPRQSNIVELVSKSELIIRGTVTSVSDGIDARGLPYTEVTLRVAEAIRGEVGATYTFRQFGLIRPRDMGDGRLNVMVTPADWPTYQKGESTILFLNRHAKWTGLQTTVGLGHGKFNVALAGAANHANNAGLFEHIAVDSGLLAESDRRVMNTQKGAVNAEAFLRLVRKIVDGRWIEQGSMRNEQH